MLTTIEILALVIAIALVIWNDTKHGKDIQALGDKHAKDLQTLRDKHTEDLKDAREDQDNYSAALIVVNKNLLALVERDSNLLDAVEPIMLQIALLKKYRKDLDFSDD